MTGPGATGAGTLGTGTVATGGVTVTAGVVAGATGVGSAGPGTAAGAAGVGDAGSGASGLSARGPTALPGFAGVGSVCEAAGSTPVEGAAAAGRPAVVAGAAGVVMVPLAVMDGRRPPETAAGVDAGPGAGSAPAVAAGRPATAVPGLATAVEPAGTGLDARFSAGAATAAVAAAGVAGLGVPAPNWPVLAGEGLPDAVVEAVAAAEAAAGPTWAGEGAATETSAALTGAAPTGAAATGAAATGAAAAGAATAARPGTGDRGATWVTGACCPTPDTDSPRPPTFAVWPAPTSVCWPVFSDVTWTLPRLTATRPSARPTATVKCVPLTTAANVGVSTEKCWTFRLSTSKLTEPAFSSTVVERPWLGCSLIATVLAGPITIDSVPRCSATRARSPVWTATPGAITMPTAMGDRASCPVQAWPETLETCQSAAQAAAPCRLVRTVRRPETARARERKDCMPGDCGRNG